MLPARAGCAWSLVPGGPRRASRDWPWWGRSRQRLRAALAAPGVEAGARALAERGALSLDGQQLCLILGAEQGELEGLLENMVALARSLEQRTVARSATGGLAGVAEALALQPLESGVYEGSWRGRVLRLRAAGAQAELHLPLAVALPAGFAVVARDGPAGLLSRLHGAPVPVPLQAAAVRWRVCSDAPEAARALLEQAAVVQALEGVVDLRGGHVAGDVVVRRVGIAALALAPAKALEPMVAAAEALEQATLQPLEALAGRWGLELELAGGRPALLGRVGPTWLRLECGRRWQLQARPAAGLRVGLSLRAREEGERGGTRSGHPIFDAAAVVTVEDGLPLGVTPAQALPLVAGRGAAVERGVLQWSGAPLPPARPAGAHRGGRGASCPLSRYPSRSGRAERRLAQVEGLTEAGAVGDEAGTGLHGAGHDAWHRGGDGVAQEGPGHGVELGGAVAKVPGLVAENGDQSVKVFAHTVRDMARIHAREALPPCVPHDLAADHHRDEAAHDRGQGAEVLLAHEGEALVGDPAVAQDAEVEALFDAAAGEVGDGRAAPC